MNKGLGFTAEDRAENIRRVGEVSKLFNQAGQIVFCSFIAPEAGPRDQIAATHKKDNLNYCETYISTSLEDCEERDPKGLYKKARSGAMKNFTGIDAPYDEPKEAGLTIDTGKCTVEENVQMFIDDMLKKSIIK
jgi:adenylylsulfate kinase